MRRVIGNKSRHSLLPFQDAPVPSTVHKGPHGVAELLVQECRAQQIYGKTYSESWCKAGCQRVVVRKTAGKS